MDKRSLRALVLVGFLIIALPLLNVSTGKTVVTSVSVAIAGQTVGGTRCDCGTPGCSPCLPETQTPPQPSTQPQQQPTSLHEGAGQEPPNAESVEALLLIALVLTLMWLRL